MTPWFECPITFVFCICPKCFSSLNLHDVRTNENTNDKIKGITKSFAIERISKRDTKQPITRSKRKPEPPVRFEPTFDPTYKRKNITFLLEDPDKVTNSGSFCFPANIIFDLKFGDQSIHFNLYASDNFIRYVVMSRHVQNEYPDRLTICKG